MEQAVALHRNGDLAAAERAYRALLRAAPKNPFLLGQLGAVALKRGREAEAATLLRTALAAGGSPGTRLSNLQAHLGLLRRKGRSEEARRLVAGGIADWPEGVRPSAEERTMLLSLARALSELGQPRIGARLLDQAFPDSSGDAEVLTVTGRLRLAADDAEGAVRPLQRALELAPDRPAPLIALTAALDRAGRRAEAREGVGQVARCFAYWRGPRRDGQGATILVLNPPPRRIRDPAATVRNLHFRVNFAAEFARRMADRYRFLSVLATIPPEQRPWQADAPSVVLSNLANELEMSQPAALERARALIDRIGVPVINPPEAVGQVTRETNARALAGIAGLRMPRTARCRIAEGGVDAVVAEIGRTIGYPAILRHLSTHSTANSLIKTGPKSVYLVSSEREAREALAEAGWKAFYAIEFVDLLKKQGWYRKIRAVFVGDEMVIYHGGCSGEWIVSGWFDKPEGIAFYRAHPAAVDHLRAILNDPEAELGAGCLEVLRQIRDRIPLDIFGVDFDVDDSGQVVFFEASAGVVFKHPTEGVSPDLWLPTEPFERVEAAFHDLVARRIAEGTSEAAPVSPASGRRAGPLGA